MKLFGAFLRLIRWPNLLFIALTQILFVYCILLPLFNQEGTVPNIRGWHFILLCFSSILIAAAGYIINDYFDLNIDRINKPDKLIVEKIIQRRWAIILHLLLSSIGILIGFYLDITTGIAFLGLANTCCVVLLFVYSISLKKKILLGNILISLLTAWVILVIFWCEGNHYLHTESVVVTEKFTRLTFLYAGFAFIISLIREVVKDMEDIEGDRRYGCYTLPIAWGVNVSKLFASVWIIVLIAILVIVQFYVLQFGWWASAFYCMILIIIPLLWVFKKLLSANSMKDFHELSSVIKIIMFTGIISMVFFKLYQ